MTTDLSPQNIGLYLRYQHSLDQAHQTQRAQICFANVERLVTNVQGSTTITCQVLECIMDAAIVCKNQKNIKGEEFVIRNAVQLYPREARYHLYLATVLERLGRVQEAEATFLKAISLDPEDPEIYFNYGIFLENRNELKKAKFNYEKALRLDPNHEKTPPRLERVNTRMRDECADALLHLSEMDVV